jgi:hypothetical protein
VAAFAFAGFAALVIAQLAHAAYTGGQASVVGALRGAAVFTFVFTLGALAGFGVLPRQAASVLHAALLGVASAVPIAMLAAYAAPSVGIAGAAGFVALGAAVTAYVGGGGLRAR